MSPDVEKLHAKNLFRVVDTLYALWNFCRQPAMTAYVGPNITIYN